MIDENLRGFIRDFCESVFDSPRLEPFLHDDVEWMVFGPMDLLPFFGRRQGKQAVLAMCREIAATLELQKCEKEASLFDGQNAAAMVKITTLYKPTGRVLSLRLAQFAQFRDGKLQRIRAVFDSFDAAEQTLGRQIDLSAAA